MTPPRSRLPKPLRQTLRDRARGMRREPSPAEQKLWSHLRGDQLGGFRFRRQHVIGQYIVDFFCNKAHLVVEIDGDSHAERAEYDRERDECLRERFLRVLRFMNSDVFENLDGVLAAIFDACSIPNSPSPLPSPRDGERG